MATSRSMKPSVRRADLMRTEVAIGRFAEWLRRWNYDVRVRSYPVVREICKSDPTRRWAVLDVGSGDTGLAALLPGRRVVSLDREFGRRPIGPFIRGSALNLPFEDRSWDVVTCIDVIEHMTRTQRARALSEILRVSRKMAIVAFPFGGGARGADADMAAAYLASGLPLPPWLDEHLRQPHPEVESTEEVIREFGGARIESIEHTYNESLLVQRFHRLLARRSMRGYQLSSVLCGMAAPWLARPLATSEAYRSTVIVTLGPQDEYPNLTRREVRSKGL